ncbi:hypothetical protein [Acetobacter sp.]|uniref:hypothetical protein n=1 Tax=Acetobacter sp. TaxID=440 RepID=UPI0025C5F34F|nr:hypothetical protein [Acetobacter sp.]MCH4090720.1 hypothetical protein [Acetobacter sp.]
MSLLTVANIIAPVLVIVASVSWIIYNYRIASSNTLLGTSPEKNPEVSAENKSPNDPSPNDNFSRDYSADLRSDMEIVSQKFQGRNIQYILKNI